MGERTRELAVLIIGDVVVFVVALWLTLLIRYVSIPDWELFADHLGPFLILSTVWLLIFYVAGLYDKQTVFLKSQLFKRILNAQVMNAIAATFVFLIIPFGIAPKTNLVIYIMISIGLMTWWRASLYNKIEPKTRHRAILLADGPEAIELVDETNNNDRYNYTFVRLIDKKTATSTENFQSKLLTLIEKENIDIVVANPDLDYVNQALPKIFDLSFLRFRITFLDFYKVYENTFDRVPVDSIQYDWFLSNISQSKNAIYNFLKRTIDIFGALLLILPSALLFPVVAALIKLEDKGPLFYSTSRVGQFNKLITIYKFRTKNGADSGAAALNSILVDTKIGRILRKTRIDELPQLLNVLKGDLSFIGPRPEMPSLVDVYVGSVPYYNARHFLKPGLSGWAQINNFDVPRGGIDIERTKVKVSYDLYYLEHHSLLLDTQIALKTIATIIMRTGS